jgi:hypothetical protein
MFTNQRVGIEFSPKPWGFGEAVVSVARWGEK